MTKVREFQSIILSYLEKNYNRYGLRSREWLLAWTAWESNPVFQERAKKLFEDPKKDQRIEDIWVDWRKYPSDKIFLIFLCLPFLLSPMFKCLDRSIDPQQYYIPDSKRKLDYEKALSLLQELKEIFTKYAPTGKERCIAGILHDMAFGEKEEDLLKKFMKSMPIMMKQIEILNECFQGAINGQENRLPYRKGESIKKTVALQVALGLAKQQKMFLGKPLYQTACLAASIMTFPEEESIEPDTIRSMATRKQA